MSDTIDRQAAIDALNVGAELLRRVLDDADIVGAEREKYEWGLGLIESNISDMKELPSAQPDYKEVLGWLLAYHTISFDLHGRYLPHEVISWLINDFTREFISVREQNE
jgi:hypothetical protein